ncbi:MAG: hypothetical protein JW841_16610 [Deltaproteobacteria bacterium]|nr:hypothetical protein [Deltaproteobacteria bacterium]
MISEITKNITKILDRLVALGEIKAAMLHDRSGICVASCGDIDSIAVVSDTHFGKKLDLGHICRDECGSTVLSQNENDAVRLEAIAAHYILTLVLSNPLIDKVLRLRIDTAKRDLGRVLLNPKNL